MKFSDFSILSVLSRLCAASVLVLLSPPRQVPRTLRDN